MRHIIEMNSGEEDLKDTSAEVVRQNDIRVNLMEPGNESFKKLSFILEDVDGCILLLLQPLLKVKRPWLLVEHPNHSEA
jgi:hypothetical protein